MLEPAENVGASNFLNGFSQRLIELPSGIVGKWAKRDGGWGAPRRTTRLSSSNPASSECDVPANCDNARPTMIRYLRHVRPLCVRCTWEIRVVVSVAACS